MLRWMVAVMVLSLSMTAMAESTQKDGTQTSSAVTKEQGKVQDAERRAHPRRGDKTRVDHRSKKSADGRTYGRRYNGERADRPSRGEGEYRGKRGAHRRHGDANRTYTKEEAAEREARHEAWKQKREAERNARDASE